MDIEKFKKLIGENKTEEAKEALKDFFLENLSAETGKEAMVDLVAVYLQIQNSIDEQYIKVLDAALAELDRFEKRKNSLSDAINLEAARKQLT